MLSGPLAVSSGGNGLDVVERDDDCGRGHGLSPRIARRLGTLTLGVPAKLYSAVSMPIYEYRCKKGHTFDVMQRFSDDALDTCQVCRAPAQRVLHAPAVHFKGSGFYNTDYGTRKRSREMKEKEGAASSDSKSSSTETKSASGDSGANGSKPSDSSSSQSKAKAAD
jgi:putative FmdB family regulatory protein